MTRGLPGGTVTLALGDVEASTQRWEASRDGMAAAMTALNAAVDELVAAHDGARPVEQGEGDSFVAGFGRASDAVRFAIALQADSPLPIRIGVHTGEVDVVDGGYAGPTIIRAARLRDAGHGGQVLLSQTTAALVADDVELDDLGEHHLKGLTRPERIFQLPGEFPPLRLDNDTHMAPARLTKFIGREVELTHVRDLLKEPGCVTITGAGGAGKTRLTLELMTHEHGWFVDLAAVDREDSVALSVADAVQARMTPGRAVLDAVAAAIGDKDAVLVLDNCEHVLAACTAVAANLLSRCESLTVLATSREPLGLDGEVTYRLPSLSESEATQLFVERARRANPRFELDAATATTIAEICQRLDGMPLAIELAAARMRVFSAAQLLDALHDRFRLLTGGARTAMPRQRTLEASVEWSFALLLDAERTLLRRLSVFAGGFTTDAAMAVAADEDLEPHHVFDLLVALVEKSLIAPDERAPGRFSMLETIRHFAAARLVDAGEADACRRRHYELFLRVAHHSRDQTEEEWRAVVELEAPNIGRALQWASDQPGYEALFALTQDLGLYWSGTRRVGEGLAWVQALDRRTHDAPAHVRARVLRDYSLLMTTMGDDWVRGGELALEALALARTTGDDGLVLRCALYCHPALTNAGCLPADFYDEMLALAHKSDDPRPLAILTAYRGFQLMREAGDFTAARPVLADAFERLRACGVTRLAATADAWLAMGEAIDGDLTTAIPHLDRAADALRDGQETFVLSNVLAIAAGAHAAAGDHAGVAHILSELDAIAEAGGDFMTVLNRGLGHGIAAIFRGDWSEASEALAVLGPLRGSDAIVAPLRSILGVALVMEGRLDEAEAIAATTPPTYSVGGLAIGNAAFVRALVASRRGDEAQAWELAYDGWSKVPAMAFFGTLPAIVLARSGARLGRVEEAARLSGWVRAQLGDTTPTWLELFEDTDDLCRAALGHETHARLTAEGATLTAEQALAVLQRGRGSRQRPMLGWDSLTPTEAEVAALVAQGQSNKEVAAQLFMSEATVKTHLTRIYAKVGVRTRSQLAASARPQIGDA